MIVTKKGDNMRDEKGRFIKGHHSSPETQFKKGDNLREKHPRWKGGRFKDTDGYIRILMPNHPDCSRQGYILEHRYLIEQKTQMEFCVEMELDLRLQENKIMD